MNMEKKYHEMIQRCNFGICWMVLEGFWPMNMERIAFEGKKPLITQCSGLKHTPRKGNAASK